MKRSKGYRLIAVTILLLVSVSACSMRDSEGVPSPTATLEEGAGEVTSAASPAPAEPTATMEPVDPTEAPAPDLPASTQTPDPDGGDEPGDGSGEAPAGDGDGTPQPPEIPPVEEDPLEIADIPELEFGSLDAVEGGLTSLGTFRQRMTVDFVGADAGYNGIYIYESEADATNQAVHITVRADGEAVQTLPANQLEAIWVGGNLWIKIGNQPWLPVPLETAHFEFDQQFIGVGAFLPYVQVFERVGEEDINGIRCAHYTYDADDLETQNGTVSGRGDVYVAIEGGYVVRYTFSGSGTFQAPFQGSGTVDLVYDTYDVGADITVRPPRR